MKRYLFFSIFFIVLFLNKNLFANCLAETPQNLITLIGESISKENLEDFSCLFEVSEGKTWLKISIEGKYNPKFKLGKIISSDNEKAVILLMGIASFGNSGNETYFSRNFSGIYEAEKTSAGWKVKKALPYKKNLIKSQTLDVEVIPGEKLIVKDTLIIKLKNNLGFAATLNHKAKISKVKLNNEDADYEFDGGLLWVKNEALQAQDKLVIEYELNEIETKEDDANSSFWGSDFGHIRNQFTWHPLYDFSNPNGFSAFEITARIPKEFHLVTSLPQKEKIIGKYKIVSGKGLENTPALALFYDKEWKLITRNYGDLQFDIFSGANFSPTVEELQQEFYRIYTELEKRFGKPISKYFNVVQDRSRKNGWLYLTNQTITAGATGGAMSFNQKYVRAPFHHEVAHLWTTPTGDGANFLREGWASFAETYFIRTNYGEDAENRYYDNYRKNYESGNFDNQISILTDFNNSGVSYSKGLWIFKMLRDFVGEKAFETGMRKYISESRLGKTDINSFIYSFSKASPKKVKDFLNPWLTEKVLPNVSARIFDKKIEIKQEGAIFLLPVEVEFETNKGKIRKTFQIFKPVNVFNLNGLGIIKSFVIDPNNQLLLKTQTTK